MLAEWAVLNRTDHCILYQYMCQTKYHNFVSDKIFNFLTWLHNNYVCPLAFFFSVRVRLTWRISTSCSRSSLILFFRTGLIATMLPLCLAVWTNICPSPVSGSSWFPTFIPDPGIWLWCEMACRNPDIFDWCAKDACEIRSS